jgi:uncharacterized protein YuzE
MAISYNPSKDELVVKLRPTKGKPSKVVDHFKLWWDAEGNICAIDIEHYTDALKAFEKNLRMVRLGGLWRGIEISEEKIRQARQELVEKLEEKW